MLKRGGRRKRKRRRNWKAGNGGKDEKICTSWDRITWQSSLDTADFSMLGERRTANLDNVFTESYAVTRPRSRKNRSCAAVFLQIPRLLPAIPDSIARRA